MTRLSLTILALLLAQPSARAQTGCTEYKNIAVVHVGEGDMSLDGNGSRNYRCDDFKMLDDIVDDLRRISPFNIEPLTVVASGVPVPGTASFDPSYSKIEVHFNPTSESDLRAMPRVFSHETGHYILQALLNEKIPAYLELRKVRHQRDLLMEAMKPAYQLMSQDPACRRARSACRERLDEIIEAIPEELKNSEKNLHDHIVANAQALSKFNEIDAPFHELYADIVAAIRHQDPDANVPGLREGRRETRAFSRRQENFHPTEEPHDAFAPIRYDLWQQWVRPRLNNKKQLLKELAEAFLAEIQRQGSEGKVNAEESMARLRTRLGLRHSFQDSEIEATLIPESASAQ